MVIEFLDSLGRRESRRDRRNSILGLEGLEARRLLAVTPVAMEVGRFSDFDGNGVVYGRRALILGRAEPGSIARVDLDGDGEFDIVKRAGGLGRFGFITPLREGSNQLTASVRSPSGMISTADLSVVRGDVVIAWNRTLLNLIRSEATGPPRATRALAMVHLAMLQAVDTTPTFADPVAASEAAYQVLLTIYPERADELRASRREVLMTTPVQLRRAIGIREGAAAGQRMVVDRLDDGSSAVSTYQPVNLPGRWVPTPPRFLPGLAPQWGGVRGFAIDDFGDFALDPPPALNSSEYADALRSVEQIGGTISGIRTADQTALAHFWADLPGESFTPPGHWNQIAQQSALAAGHTLQEDARLFAMLNVALADAAIGCWGAKYQYDLWRPETAIHQADSDGNPETTADPDWTPLWTSPNFPAYTSGHSSFSGAAQVVLESEFGADHPFLDGGDPALGLPARRFDSFAQAADEAGISRVYGGIHFPFDNTAGLRNGRAIGKYVVTHFTTI